MAAWSRRAWQSAAASYNGCGLHPAAAPAGRTAVAGGMGVAELRNFSGAIAVGIHVPILEVP
jgi:hypothetical protein